MGAMQGVFTPASKMPNKGLHEDMQALRSIGLGLKVYFWAQATYAAAKAK